MILCVDNEKTAIKEERTMKKGPGTTAIAMVGIAACLLLATVPAWSAAPEDGETGLTIEPEFYWDSGDYGGDSTINTYSFSLTGEYAFADRWTLSLTIVPYLHQDETYTDVVLVDGKPVHHQDPIGTNPHHPAETMHGGNTAMHSGTTTMHGGQGHGHGNTATAAAPISTETAPTVTEPVQQVVKRHGSESGVGDTSLDLSYRFLDETETLPEMSVHGGIKIPTADEDKGLGTGEMDYRFGVELVKELGGWSAELGMDYNILGDPDDYDLDNYVSAYGELSTEFLPRLTTIFKLAGAQAASEESDAELSAGLECDYDFDRAGTVYAGMDAGLSDGSPDFALYVGYSFSF